MKGFGDLYKSTRKSHKKTKLAKDQIIKQAFKFHSQGNIPEAAKYYQYFINQGFVDHRVFSNYGGILNKVGRLKDAEFFTRKAIELKPDFADAYLNLGSILITRGNLEDAEFFTRKAIELKPELTEGYANLGMIFRDLGRLKEAEFFTRKAIELKPALANAYLNLGNILCDLGKLQDAE